MSEGEALLRGVLLRPDDDTARLVYADWLQENRGHAGAQLARFIRDQIWLWANPSCGSCTGPEWAAGKFCPECREREERRGRTAVEMFGRGWWLEWSSPANKCVPAGALWDDHIQFARGFVSEIHLPLAAFMEHAKALFSAHPIERVTLTDKEPLHFTLDADPVSPDWPHMFVWIRPAGHEAPTAPVIPIDLWALLRQQVYGTNSKRYEAREIAFSDLSDACVAYGRSLADLPAALPVPLAPAM
jgi:uncharacterized protein (TIGR02996 family)